MKGKKERLPMFSSTLIFLFTDKISSKLISINNKMISYNSNKYNNLIKQIVKILQINNINTEDSEQTISSDILELITKKVQLCVVSAEHFLTEKCPKCGKTHLRIFSSTYSRNIIFKINNLLIKINISIPRLICENCNSTHAVLPDFCIPLKQYSKQAVLNIANIALKTSTEDIANKLNIDSKQVRRLVNLVKKQVHNICLINRMLNSKFKNSTKLYTLLKYLPKDISKIYFANFNTIFLYEANKRNLYLRYAKLSI